MLLRQTRHDRRLPDVKIRNEEPEARYHRVGALSSPSSEMPVVPERLQLTPPALPLQESEGWARHGLAQVISTVYPNELKNQESPCVSW